MKMKTIVAAVLFAGASFAMAEEAVQLSADQMDSVTAGAASGLVFNLVAFGDSFALTQIEAATTDLQTAVETVQLTSISTTQSSVNAIGLVQAF